jgi:RHS repeat-associated protein
LAFAITLLSLLVCKSSATRTAPRFIAQYDHDPYGRLIRETGPNAATCPFRYSTKYRDPDLDLYYYGYRWYDAASLKWLTPDPIGERGGANLTAFCSGDPINQVDPLGLEEFEVVGRVPHTFDATDLLRRYIPSLDQLIGFRIDPGANDGRGALYVFLPAAYLEPGVLREEAAQGDGRYSREASEQEYAWFFLALWEQNVRENPKLSADLQSLVGLGYGGDPRRFAADMGRIWRAYHRGETSKLILKDAGQQLVFSARKARKAATSGVRNPLPERMARVIPDGIPATTLGRPDASDVYVTAAEDIAGMNAAEIAERLKIPLSQTGFKIIEFPTPQTGIASPVFRTDPGFVGTGRTGGGAREFVIPNQPIPPGSIIRRVQ